MISLPLLISLLTLIDVTRSFEYFIDLERCKTKEMVCYARESCIVSPEDPTDNPENNLAEIKKKTLKGGTCDVIVQMKAFTKSRYYIMMQVNASASESPLDVLDTEKGLSIVQSETQIQCNSSGIGGRLEPSPYGTRQMNKKELIFCSVIISTNAPETIYQLFPDVKYGLINPTFEFSFINKPATVVKVPLDINFGGDQFWNLAHQCDDKAIASKNIERDGYLLTSIDTAPVRLTCPDSLQIRLELPATSAVIWPNYVFCNVRYWTYHKDGEDTVIAYTVPFYVHCAVAFSELCSPLPFKPCTGCTKLESSKNETTCPSDNWRMSDGSVVKTTVKCKQRGQTRESGWHMENGTELTEGSCSNEFDCIQFSHLVLATEDVKAIVSPNGQKITCPNGFNMTVSSSDPNDFPTNATSLSCNAADGLFYFGKSGKNATRGSTVTCLKPPEPVPEPAPAAASIAPFIGYGLGGIIVLGAIVTIAVMWARWILKRRRLMEEDYIKHPDGMRTCKEVDEMSERVDTSRKQWRIKKLTKSQRLRQKIYVDGKPPKPFPFGVVEPVTQWNGEVEPRIGEFVHWKPSSFSDILCRLHRYSVENRLKCLRALTAFMHHSDIIKEDKKFWAKKRKGFGKFTQFIEAMKLCHMYKLKCYETWDFFFRLLKIFCENLIENNMYKIPARLRKVILRIGNDIIYDIGYRQKPDDTDMTAGLRLVAVRMLLYVKDQNCINKIREMANLPLDQIDSPLRMVVYSYAINHMGKEQIIKDAFYREVGMETKEPPRGMTHGTYRQHLIYALCSSKEIVGDGGLIGTQSTMREILGELHKNRKLFTPTDLLYAYKGATEHRAVNFVMAHEQFATHGASYESEPLHQMMLEYAHDQEDRELIIKRWKADIVAICHIMAENCINDSQHMGIRDALAKLLEYADPDAFAKMEGRELPDVNGVKPEKPKTEFELWEESKQTPSEKEEEMEEDEKERKMMTRIVKPQPDTINVFMLAQRAHNLNDLLQMKRKDMRGEKGIYFQMRKVLNSTMLMSYEDNSVMVYD